MEAVPTISPDGWLSSATRVPAGPARSMPATGPRPVGVVWHYTASRGRTDRHAVLLAEEWTTGPGASAHVIIARSGRIVQCVPFTRGAHHCRGRWTHGVVNETTVGVELEGAGRLRLDGRWRPIANPHVPNPDEWRTDTRFDVPHAEVESFDGGFWHAYTPQQVRAAEQVLRALVAWGAPLTAESCALGHCDLDPTRKVDPGPAWLRRDLPAILARVFGAAACGAP